MKASPEQVAALRHALEALHRQRREPASAFDLARVAYLSGDYDEALDRFREAHALAPHDPRYALALARAAGGLGLRDLEAATVAHALAIAPGFAPVVLHAALLDVPRNLDAARARLGKAGSDPMCAEFERAIDRLIRGEPVPMPADGDDRATARATGGRWVQTHCPSPDVFRGLPAAVLDAALDAASLDGLVLEFGVYHGRSLRLIAARSPSTAHGFDSFEGLPEAWSAAEGAGAYSTHGRIPEVPGDVRLHGGWFENSLPPFLASHPGPVRIAHIDCDLYSSTRTVLTQLRERLVPGSVLLFDDMLGYPGYEAHELRAFEEFVAEDGRRYEILAAALLGREVAIRITG